MPTALKVALPADLSVSAGAASLLARTGIRYNYAVGGLGFLSAASPDTPIVRESVQVRKQQFDNSPTPGEQSLDGWWLRSQLSFHGGAGQNYADPTGYAGYNIDATPLTRFLKGRNVNVWEPGKVTLLNSVQGRTEGAGLVDATEFNFGNGTPGVIGVDANGNPFVLWGYSDFVQPVNPSAQRLQTVTCDGSYVYVASGEGVWSTAIPTNPGPFGTWTKEYSVTGSPKVRLGYVKSRIMFGAGPDIYELAPHPTGVPVAVSNPKYVAPDPGWSWSDFTETGAAIFAVGNNNARGSILKFVLSGTGDIPTLSGAAVAAQLPAGEIPYSAIGYLGSYIGIGTNKGVRVALDGGNGDLTYGPLMIETAAPVRSWAARDRFLYCAVTKGIDGDSGLYRIDLSTQSAEMRFAYATDLNASGDTTTCNTVAGMGNLMVFSTANQLYVENPAVLADSGYLQTSRIRFGTLEPKLFQFVKLRGPALKGPLTVDVLDEGDHAATVHTYTLAALPGDTEVGITALGAPQDFISLKFTLGRGASGGAEFWGYQLKALPGVKRQRMIQLPLACFDWERDSKGMRHGGRGSALRRLTDLEELESSGKPIVLQDFDADTNTRCVIEQISFKQTSPPPYAEGLGGIITLTLRTI